MICLLLLTLLFLVNAPLSVTLSEKTFTLKKLVGSLSIDYDQISAIMPYKFGCDIRLFGSGGLGGYIGLFSGKEIGKYVAFAGDTEQAYCIFLKNGKKYVFSCEDYESVIAFINKRIHFTPNTFTFTSDSENWRAASFVYPLFNQSIEEIINGYQCVNNFVLMNEKKRPDVCIVSSMWNDTNIRTFFVGEP